jgi:hypothetical protein
LALFRAEGDGWHTGWVLGYFSELLVRQGDFVSARSRAEESLALFRVAGDAWGMATALTSLGKADQAEGNLDAAAGQFAEALRLLVGARVEPAIPTCLEDLAGVLLASGQPALAARLAGASEALRSLGGVPHLHVPVAAELIALQTGPHAASWKAGRALTREQVYSEAWTVAESVSRLVP